MNSKKRITCKDNKNGGGGGVFGNIFSNPKYDTIESKKAEVIEILKYKKKCEEKIKTSLLHHVINNTIKRYEGRAILINNKIYYFESILDKMCDFLYYSKILHKNESIRDLIYKIIKIKTQNKNYGVPKLINYDLETGIRNVQHSAARNNRLMLPIDNIRSLMKVMIRFIEFHKFYENNEIKSIDETNESIELVKNINKEKNYFWNKANKTYYVEKEKKNIYEDNSLFLRDPENGEPSYAFDIGPTTDGNIQFSNQIKKYSNELFDWAINSVLNAWFKCELCYIDIEKVLGVSKVEKKYLIATNNREYKGILYNLKDKNGESIQLYEQENVSNGFYYNIKGIKDIYGKLIEFDSYNTWTTWYGKTKNNEAFIQKLEDMFIEQDFLKRYPDQQYTGYNYNMEFYKYHNKEEKYPHINFIPIEKRNETNPAEIVDTECHIENNEDNINPVYGK